MKKTTFSADKVGFSQVKWVFLKNSHYLVKKKVSPKKPTLSTDKLGFSLINPVYLGYLPTQIRWVYLENNLYLCAQIIPPYLCAQIIWVFSDKPGLTKRNPLYLQMMWGFSRETYFI